MSSRLKIAFMTTIGRNVGDEFIREGIRSFFDDVLGEYEAFYVDKHDLTTLHRRVYDEPRELADKFRDADVIVQAGAPVYWNNGRFKSYNADWAQVLWYDRIFKLGGEKVILNLGAGAGQKSEDDLATLLADPRLIEFARQAGRSCAWTTARDPLAARFLEAVGVDHERLVCPAFHAARRVNAPAAPDDLLAVNLMPKAGHYRLKPQTEESQWRSVIDGFLPRLRSHHRLVFVAHDQAEAEFERQFLQGDESIFISQDYREYIAMYGRVKGIVTNRVHGAVCVAGFGRPAVIVGNDARVGIARPIGIPAKDSSEATADWVVESLQSQFDRAERLCSERLAMRESTARHYAGQIGQLLSARCPVAEAA